MTAQPRRESLLEPPVGIDLPEERFPGSSLTIHRIDSDQGLADFKGAWEALFQRGSLQNPFLTWGWMSSWWRHFGKGKRLEVLFVREGERLIGIAPFYTAEERVMGISFRRLSLLGDEGVGSDHLDFLSEKGFEERVASAVAEQWLKQPRNWDGVRLRGFSQDSPHLPFLIKAVEGRWRIDLESDQVCPYLLLPSTWDDYLKNLSGSMRYTIRRKMRNLEKEHDVEFVILEKGEEGRAGMEELINLHQKRWNAVGGSDAFLTDIKARFHREVANYFFERGIARLYLLRVDRQTVASLYGFSLSGRFFYYQAGFDPAWGGKSVGMALMAKSIEAAISQGWREYDFLQGSEGYKAHWTSMERKTWRISFYPPGIRTKLIRFFILSKQTMKKFVKRAVYGVLPSDSAGKLRAFRARKG